MVDEVGLEEMEYGSEVARCMYRGVLMKRCHFLYF